MPKAKNGKINRPKQINAGNRLANMADNKVHERIPHRAHKTLSY